MGFNNFDLNNFFPFFPNIFENSKSTVLVGFRAEIINIPDYYIIKKKLAHSFNVIVDIKNYILKQCKYNFVIAKKN
jgi:hypothetical protein